MEQPTFYEWRKLSKSDGFVLIPPCLHLVHNKNMQKQLPKSCTNSLSSIAGLFGFLISLTFLKILGSPSLPYSVLAICLSTALPVVAFDTLVFKTHKRASSGLDFDKSATTNLNRVYTKVIGLIGTIGSLATLYWVFPEYHGDFYNPYWSFLKIVSIGFIILAPFYIWYVDKKMLDPKDGLHEAGLFFQGSFKGLDNRKLKQHTLGWLIKGFFLPLMVVYCTQNLSGFIKADFSSGNFLFYYHRIHDFIYLIDLVFVVIGYCLSLRLFDSHIRSSDGTMFGWTVAIFCYQPFWGQFSSLYLNYGGSKKWFHWFANGSFLFYLWGGLIIFLIGVYSLASVYFGVRFSNLTHRGVITNGPFRWTKHPAYVSKNLSWWLISMPFMWAGTWSSSIRQCLILLMLNFIYYLRAKTEEKHLSKDPIYVEYALAMNDVGIFSNLSKLLPFFHYKAPNAI